MVTNPELVLAAWTGISGFLVAGFGLMGLIDDNLTRRREERQEAP